MTERGARPTRLLARIGPPGQEIPALRADRGWLDLRGVVDDLDPSFWEHGVHRLDALGLDPQLPALTVGPDTRWAAPIARPGAILCIGMNYAAHAAETGAPPPELPVLFLKTPNTLAGPDDGVPIPPRSTRTDWEVELGVVIGATACYLAGPAEALGCIGGLVTVDDVSERTFQLEESGGQWSKGKCAPGFTPVGPHLLTGGPAELTRHRRLRSWVNGEPRQDSTTADMIFDPAHLVWHLSQYLTLEPGDLLLTGTPEGVALSGRFPYLRAGDLVEVEVEGLGRARHVFRSSGGSAR